MAEADTPEQLSAMKSVFNETTKLVENLKERMARLQSQSLSRTDFEEQLRQAMAAIDRLPDLANDATDQGRVADLFQKLNVRLFLKFEEVKKTKRTVNVLSGGVVTMGAAAAPIQPYSGPTSRQAVKNPSETVSEGTHSASEDESLRNESRGSRI